MDDSRTERNITLAVGAIWLGLSMAAYRSLAAVAARGGDLSAADHLSVFVLAGVVVPLCVGAVAFSLVTVAGALGGGAKIVRWMWRSMGKKKTAELVVAPDCIGIE